MMNKLFFVIILLTSSFFFSCKSAYEKQGDEHLEAGRYLKALQRYKYVSTKGNGSQEFAGNLAMAYVGAMAEAAEKGADITSLITYREKINEQLQTGNFSASKAFYAKTGVELARKFIAESGFDYVNLAFSLIKDAEKTGSLAPESKSQIQGLKTQYIASNMREAEDAYQACMNGEATQGIIADYIMSKLALFVTPTSEMEALWSKIKKANLSTYLMYDLEGLIERPLPQINKYGVLIGITAMSRSGSAVSFQLKIFNGSTSNLTYVAKGFTLTDKEGNNYEPVSSRGAFTGKKPVEASTESGVGAVRFKVPGNIGLSHITFNSEAGASVKYLP